MPPTELVIDQTPPILHGPSDKEKKYDRQLRLWAANGQAALEDAHVLLLNSGSGTVGAETLKNLVLPGIGKFTIADAATVDEADLGVNFFLDESSLGKSRAQCCTELLQELNPDVKGFWIQVKSSSRKRSPDEMADADFEPMQKKADLQLKDTLGGDQKYSLIIYTAPISKQDLDIVKAYGLQYKVPLFSIQSAGFYSYFEITLPGAFPIVDTHPDTTAIPDLRLLAPWQELSEFASNMTANIDQLDDHEHGHIPYLVLILHYLEEWKKTSESDGPPVTGKEKKAFKEFLAKGTRKGQDAENFHEATAAITKLLQYPEISGDVKEIFGYKDAPMDGPGSTFWIIAGAVKQFYEKHGVLPLPGNVPDMKAKSNVYVELQNVYKAKARQDAAEVLETVRQHPNGSPADIPNEEVDAFCKNAAFIKLIRGSDSAIDLQELADNDSAMNGDFALLPIYLSLKATQHGPLMSQAEILFTTASQVPETHSLYPRLVKVAGEVARARGTELHNISALTGGMVAQEVIKIITKQYTPVDNTCVFDGIASRSQVFRL